MQTALSLISLWRHSVFRPLQTTNCEVSRHQINTENVIEISVNYIISGIDYALISSAY